MNLNEKKSAHFFLDNAFELKTYVSNLIAVLYDTARVNSVTSWNERKVQSIDRM